MALGMTVSGFALEKGEYVYTPQGRFQITGDNQNANNAFQTMDGWTAIGEGKTLADLFITNADGLAAGFNSVVSTAATAGEGMYFKFEPTSAGETYVVSFKMKGTALACTETRIPGDGNKRGDNLVKVAGNAENTYTYPSTEGEFIANTAEELNENWQTFYYAINVGESTAPTWFISFTGMATTVEIADLQIAPAMQFADLRQRDAMLEKLNAYKNAYNWSEDLLAEFAVTETIESLAAIGDESGQAELDEVLGTAQEVLDEFLKENMDDYLAANPNNYFSTWVAKWQKVEYIGEWLVYPSKRGFWENANNICPDLGHFAGNSAWCGGSPDAPMGVSMQKEMDPGSYVFSIEGAAALREDATSSSWTINEGWNPAYGVAYVVKINEGADPDTIVSVVKNLDAVVFTPFIASFAIQEAGVYEIGYKSYCKEAYRDLKNGSVSYVKDARLWGKNNNKYSQRQLGYEADVREQIAAGRTALTTAVEYLDNADYLWGKATLKACVDSVEVKIGEYEAMTQDDIIATYDNYDGEYVKSTSSEDGILVYEVYQAAVKDILAANKTFVAVNDTLNSMQTIIDNAEVALALRVYSAATGKADLQGAIATAKDVQAKMKAADYSEENAAAIVAANEALNVAIDAFKASVPASAITSLVDIDFEQAAELNAETGLYQISGAAGTMVFSKFVVDANSTDQSFQQGKWDNGEQLFKGYVRVGNGDGTVDFEPGDMGTNIMRVSCDFFLQGLSGRNVGFFLTAPTDSTDVTVASYYANYYNGTVDATSTLPIELSSLQYASGGNYNNAAPEGADSTATYVCAKNSFEVILDFGEGTIYATTTSAKGTVTTAKQEFDKVAPNKFILRCNYNNDDRRVWFDNLKIERIAAGAVDGIQEINGDAKVVVPTKVFKNGRIVINGKYGINGMIIK